ncbi:hypothetical protein U9M48_026509 [Paspalum notatum var. saurae]|uniref:Uncharacterized protein n=1 Tax=Paspalum notatum var. saurae TaxID=547442 RepID=A0AAQ3WZ32_PASNO
MPASSTSGPPVPVATRLPGEPRCRGVQSYHPPRRRQGVRPLPFRVSSARVSTGFDDFLYQPLGETAILSTTGLRRFPTSLTSQSSPSAHCPPAPCATMSLFIYLPVLLVSPAREALCADEELSEGDEQAEKELYEEDDLEKEEVEQDEERSEACQKKMCLRKGSTEDVYQEDSPDENVSDTFYCKFGWSWPSSLLTQRQEARKAAWAVGLEGRTRSSLFSG